VDRVWGNEKPQRPNEIVKKLDLEFSGKPFEEKIADVRKELDKKKSAGLIVCMCRERFSTLQGVKPLLTFSIAMLDEVAWLFNLRGNEYVPQSTSSSAINVVPFIAFLITPFSSHMRL
jgi:Xaa-Pro aminopeptidase